jgi:galactose mutarotase-like enzyme
MNTTHKSKIMAVRLARLQHKHETLLLAFQKAEKNHQRADYIALQIVQVVNRISEIQPTTP